jgi:hypothetical protein
MEYRGECQTVLPVAEGVSLFCRTKGFASDDHARDPAVAVKAVFTLSCASVGESVVILDVEATG